MNFSKSNKARNMTLLGLAAGLVLTPLVIMGIRRWRKSRQQQSEGDVPPNHLFSAYRRKFRGQRRRYQHDGVH
jgi:hypothetical protein